MFTNFQKLICFQIVLFILFDGGKTEALHGFNQELKIQEAINAISSSNFSGADSKIMELVFESGVYNVRKIVQTIRATEINSFDSLIIDFIGSSDNIFVNYFLAIVLWDEIKSKNEIRLITLIKFSETICKSLLNKNASFKVFESNLRKLCDSEIQPNIILQATKELSEALLINSQYKYWQLGEKIRDLGEEVLDEITRHVVDYSYEKISKENLIRSIFYLNKASQIASALAYLQKKLKENSDDTDSLTLLMAALLRNLKQISNYKSISELKKFQVQNAINNLPNSVKNLYFSDEICIRNVNNDEYLFASKDKWNQDRRFVCTGTNKGPETVWYVTRESENTQFIFKSAKYDNHYGREPLFAGAYGLSSIPKTSEVTQLATSILGDVKIMDNYRYVFTWTSERLTIGTTWKIELHGNEIKIRNLANQDEALCVAFKIPGDERKAFTVSQPRWFDDCDWTVEDCSGIV